MSMDEFDTDVLAALIRRRHECLSQLAGLVRHQAELIDGGDLSRLLAVLASKQRLLGGLQETERRLDPFRSQAPEDRRWRDQAERRRCAELLAQCEALLAEILEEEKRSEQKLVLRREELAGRLSAAHAASLASKAYAGESHAPCSQIDFSSGW